MQLRTKAHLSDVVKTTVQIGSEAKREGTVAAQTLIRLSPEGAYSIICGIHTAQNIYWYIFRWRHGPTGGEGGEGH